MIDSLMTLSMTRVYTVNSSCKAFAKSSAMNNSNAYSFISKYHVFIIMFIQICLNCILVMMSNHHSSLKHKSELTLIDLQSTHLS